MKTLFVIKIVSDKFTSIRCRQCNQSQTFTGDNIECKIEAFKSGHEHELATAPKFNRDRFVNSVIGKFGE